MSKAKYIAYRNPRPVASHQGMVIDKGSLWHREADKNFLVLVDEDEYITADFILDFFTLNS
jgi:streptogramin lyase